MVYNTAMINKLNKTLVYFLVLTIISSALAYKIVLSAYASYGYDVYYENYTVTKSAPNKYANLIKVFSPTANASVASPLVVKGEAKGNWYFEASFPVRLYDANNAEVPLTPSYIMTTEEWMTTEFVPFEATLTFTKPTTPTGTLVLEKDNPSGLPEFDASISIPIKFE